jgi:hypothetical protein
MEYGAIYKSNYTYDSSDSTDPGKKYLGHSGNCFYGHTQLKIK